MKSTANKFKKLMEDTKKMVADRLEALEATKACIEKTEDDISTLSSEMHEGLKTVEIRVLIGKTTSKSTLSAKRYMNNLISDLARFEKEIAKIKKDLVDAKEVIPEIDFEFEMEEQEIEEAIEDAETEGDTIPWP